MVFIHGGALTVGSSSDLDASPLAAIGDVIVVTLNYRLNIFGFFATGDGGIPGNLGMMDQRLALQWVYENIEAFGGDPEQITLFGESSGASSVGFHLALAESRKYFQRAILQSGSPFMPWARVLTSDEVSETNSQVADIAGCTVEDLAGCLKAKPADELLNIHRTVGEFLSSPVSIWQPVNDKDFFPTDAYTSINNGNFSGLDIIIGTNEDEGTFETFIRTGFPYSRPNVTKEFFSFFTTEDLDPLRTSLVEAVYADDFKDSNYEAALSAALGDTQYTCGANYFAEHVATRGARVYLYRMTMEPIHSVFPADWLGATHADELQFVFGLPFVTPATAERTQRSFREVKFSYYFVKIWSQFAKSGDPNVAPRYISSWPEYTPDTREYKELDLGFSNKRNLRRHQCNFWDSLYPQIKTLQEEAVAGDVPV